MIHPSIGTLLIAEPFLKDPNFQRTVVLICEHQEEGTLGFVLSRRHQVWLDDVMPDFEGLKIPVFYGGPVQEDTLHFIHALGDQVPGSVEVAPGIYWGGDIDRALTLLRSREASHQDFRFFIGYSGWGTGQLEQELKEKSWITSPANGDLVFSSDENSIWKNALKRMGGDYELMVHFPTDPSLN
jgi:putative transcriptional regulator